MTREQRLAENEILFRKVNEQIAGADTYPTGEQIAFMCECADLTCTQVIRLTVQEYEQLRSNPTRFAVLPGH
jgi:hypothetical protein